MARIQVDGEDRGSALATLFMLDDDSRVDEPAQLPLDGDMVPADRGSDAAPEEGRRLATVGAAHGLPLVPGGIVHLPRHDAARAPVCARM